MTATTSANVDPEIYRKSGDIQQHLEGIKKQYDTAEKQSFYRQVMGDGTSNIHFGKWDNIDVNQEAAYGKAAEQMTDYMFHLVYNLLGTPKHVEYVDLGSGTGGAAIRLLQTHNFIQQATCVNLCRGQNDTAQAAACLAQVANRLQIVTASYDETSLADDSFDFAFSQDAFVHSFCKIKTYQEALRITKPGGCLVFCDLMKGTNVTEDELATFAQTNMVNDWLTPEQNIQACQQAGWTHVKFVNLTADIKTSFQLMQRKVEMLLAANGNDDGMDPVLLQTYQRNLGLRVAQVDRGVFTWGVLHAQKAK